MPRPAPRLVPELPLPPYSYVPRGSHPHPTRDVGGHSYGRVKLPCPAPDPAAWQSCQPYLYGIDLFNHGYYWEAHEVWEDLWHACGRQGTTADFFKALIALAAAGVKQREGVANGVRRHAERCRLLLEDVAWEALPGETRYLGLDLDAIVGITHRLEAGTSIAKESMAPS